jgi:(p)ppGpp synthase/HD superfamily hydrolase
MKLTARQEELLEVVKLCHGTQMRKYEAIPYWNHLYEVARLVSEYEKTDGAIEIALCHDLLEDTNCTQAEMEEKLKQIGYLPGQVQFISKGVLGMTDVYVASSYPDLNRKERKKLEATRLGSTPAIVHSVKYADMTDNVKSVVAGDRGFARVYINEMTDILDKMRLGNIHLLINCCSELRNALSQLHQVR